MEIPGLGRVTDLDENELRHSEPRSVPVLRGRTCRIVLERYDDDANKEEFHEAIRSFLAAEVSALEAAAPHIFRYYEDCKARGERFGLEYTSIERPEDVWSHITLAPEAYVQRRFYGDKAVYISLECECDWEPEHGLLIVFKKGQSVSKVGEYDGHLTNSDAYADDSLEHVIYKPL
jgi:hypothetical protein